MGLQNPREASGSNELQDVLVYGVGALFFAFVCWGFDKKGKASRLKKKLIRKLKSVSGSYCKATCTVYWVLMLTCSKILLNSSVSHRRVSL